MFTVQFQVLKCLACSSSELRRQSLPVPPTRRRHRARAALSSPRAVAATGRPLRPVAPRPTRRHRNQYGARARAAGDEPRCYRGAGAASSTTLRSRPQLLSRGSHEPTPSPLQGAPRARRPPRPPQPIGRRQAKDHRCESATCERGRLFRRRLPPPPPPHCDCRGAPSIFGGIACTSDPLAVQRSRSTATTPAALRPPPPTMRVRTWARARRLPSMRLLPS